MKTAIDEAVGVALTHGPRADRELKDEALLWINQIRFEGDNYIFVGTLGAIVTDNGTGDRMLLTNYHVAAVDDTLYSTMMS